ncbi:lysophospholipase L2 [Nitzschia inconspicua]|uniref:Lysophospholipase L2 n=1 Tax=Nitzschia inconspicua TaxID=303405 RepID=A0A9K3LS32_9STRA|nr:lysophospholipase L2 [Nitzschia inconspicua]
MPTSPTMQSRPLRFPIPAPPIPSKTQLVSPRGAKLATRVWPSIKKVPSALCLLVHGGGWHSGYFETLATSLTKHNIFVAAYDQPGDGYSEPEPDAPSPTVKHVRSFDWFVEDVFEALEWMKQEADVTKSDNIPVYLFGESFGGLVVLGAALEKGLYKSRIDGLVISGGVIHIKDEFLPPKPIVTLLLLLSKYYPKLTMPSTDFESTFDEAFGDKEWARTSRQDPKIVMRIQPTLGSVAATLGTGQLVMARAQELAIPILAIHGKNDCRADCSNMQQFVDKLGPETAKLKIVDTNGHQLLQDQPEVTKEIIDTISDWIVTQARALNG